MPIRNKLISAKSVAIFLETVMHLGVCLQKARAVAITMIHYCFVQFSQNRMQDKLKIRGKVYSPPKLSLEKADAISESTLLPGQVRIGKFSDNGGEKLNALVHISGNVEALETMPAKK